MSAVQVEAVFSTSRLDVVFLAPNSATEADKVVLASPGFFKTEYEADPEPGFVAELLEAPAPPGVSKVAVFPLGVREKGKDAYVGLVHMVMGYPTETTAFLGLFLIAESVHRKGYGKEFMEGLYDWVRPQGIGFIRARCHPDLENGRSFLDKLGFVDLQNNLSSGHQVWERKVPAVED